jgi:hypothetical protein
MRTRKLKPFDTMPQEQDRLHEKQQNMTEITVFKQVAAIKTN